MNNEELKKKIVEIIRYCYVNEKDYGYIFDVHIEEKINAIADALIAAGIGDVSEYKHRAEVAERAVYNMAYGEWQREGVRRAICEKYAPSTARDYLDRAEKELAEEGKDEER